MNHAVEPAKVLTDELGSLDDIQVFNNEVLVAIYVRPEKTNSGIILPGQTRDEDRHQGKVGLVKVCLQRELNFAVLGPSTLLRGMR
jgi:hypothetical protein